MSKASLFLTIVIALGIIIVVVYVRRTETAKAYRSVLGGGADISTMEFSGQRKRVKVEDEAICEDFQNAFKTPGKKAFRLGGMTYHVLFVLKNSANLRTAIYLSTDGSGFTIADYSRMGAGDPRYVNFEFSGNEDQRTKDLIRFLLD